MKNSESSYTYNKQGLRILIGTVVASFVLILYLSFIQNEIDLGERAVTTQSSQGLTENEQNQPWISTEKLVQKGAALYKAQCALCHGPKGLGDGSPGLIPPPRNLVEGKWKKGNGSAEHLFTVLVQGIPSTSMVSFKHISKVDRWALVHYIHSITRNKVSDDSKKLEEFAKKSL